MDLIRWYKEAKEVIKEAVGDEDISSRVIHFEMFRVIWSCFSESIDGVDTSAFFRELIISLFESLNASEDLNMNLWEEFYKDSVSYNEFEKIYKFPQGWGLRESGSFWLKYADGLCDMTIEERVDIMNRLIKFYNWIGPYCTVYAYQYHIDNYTGLRFVSERLTLLQYWEFRELETYVEKIRELELTEKIERLTRLYSDDEFDDIYPDRETLFLDFISRGISVPEALKMVKVIRCGRSDKLTDHMNELLVQAGYSGEIIQRIKAIRYLKSKSNAIIRLLYVTKLI